uniref:Gibberellin 13-oxidase n=1 Tax=Tripterygium wilfordii TaxID=458696 RepID=A0A6G7D4V7_TRIWF|nr:gibberellin 13-oxidase [Tripterygium wilfordii]
MSPTPTIPSEPIPSELHTFSTVPESHVWSKTEDFASNDQKSIPIVDLTDPNASDILGQACESWGIFQLTGHGIPEELVEQVVFQAQRFFALPTDQKMKAARLPGDIAGYGVSPLSKFYDKGFWNEGITMMGSPLDHVKKVWPDDYQQFCDAMEEYRAKMTELATTLANLAFSSFNVAEEKLQWLNTPGYAGVHLNHYPPCPNPDRTIGLAAHTDNTLLTIVHQSGADGLQVFEKSVGWVLVKPVKGAFIINVGDVLEVLSNGRYPSALHRVMVNQALPRISVAYYIGVGPDLELSPPDEVLEYTGGIKRYRSMPAGEYMGLKLKNLDQNPVSLLGI